jgi:hypothetical protein
MSNSLDNWNIRDPNAIKRIEDVNPLSARARSVLIRNRAKPMLKDTGFINVLGTIEMLEGLEYHHDNIVRITGALANGDNVSERDLNHEAVAYINRFGQFYYFAKSVFVRTAIPDSAALIPTISKFMAYRHKNSAHRSIDAPKDESGDSKLAHARALSSMMGYIMSPKPNAPTMELSDEYGNPISAVTLQRDLWKYNYRTFQTYDDDEGSHINFTVEVEHPKIANEVYSIIERVILHER